MFNFGKKRHLMEQKVSRKRRELVIDADDDDDDDLDASRIVASVITTFLRRLSVALDFKHLIVLQTLLNVPKKPFVGLPALCSCYF